MTKLIDVTTTETKKSLVSDMVSRFLDLGSNLFQIEELNLSTQKIQAQEWDLLCKILTSNKTVKVLKFMINRHTFLNIDLKKFKETLQTNTTLENITIGVSFLSDEIIKDLVSIIKPKKDNKQKKREQQNTTKSGIEEETNCKSHQKNVKEQSIDQETEKKIDQEKEKEQEKGKKIDLEKEKKEKKIDKGKEQEKGKNIDQEKEKEKEQETEKKIDLEKEKEKKIDKEKEQEKGKKIDQPNKNTKTKTISLSSLSNTSTITTTKSKNKKGNQALFHIILFKTNNYKSKYLEKLFVALQNNERICELEVIYSTLNHTGWLTFHNLIKTSKRLIKLNITRTKKNSMYLYVTMPYVKELCDSVGTRKLQSLSLNGYDFQEKFGQVVESLSNNDQLSQFNFPFNDIHKNCLTKFYKSKVVYQLKELTINIKVILDLNSKWVTKIISGSTNLKKLIVIDLDHNSYLRSQSTVNKILKAITQNKNLNEITLQNFKFYNKYEMKLLTKLFDSNSYPNLKKLFLILNDFNNYKNIETLLKCLKENYTLKHLSLRKSLLIYRKKIKNKVLEDLINNCINIYSLDLSCNSLKNDNMDVFIDRFVHNLKKIKHRNNFQFFNYSLIKLNLDHNRFSNHTILKLAGLLKVENCKIQHLSIINNDYNFFSIVQLLKIFKNENKNNRNVDVYNENDHQYNDKLKILYGDLNDRIDDNRMMEYWELINELLKNNLNIEKINFKIKGINPSSWDSLFLSSRNKHYNKYPIISQMVNTFKKGILTDSKIYKIAVHKKWFDICYPGGFGKMKERLDNYINNLPKEKYNDTIIGNLITDVLYYFYSGLIVNKSKQLLDVLNKNLKFDIYQVNYLKNTLLAAYNNDDSKDFKIICTHGGEIKVHKFILIVKSKLFSEMFHNFSMECNQIQDCTEKHLCSLKALIEFFYTEKINIKNYQKKELQLIIDELFDMVDYYQLNENEKIDDQFDNIKQYIYKN
ncbi:rni-like superfamily protein [Anaeramoeba flamelloides]|uniref:Rni-like superfamily protein n=1 Tax=Anaeramoeba flamelloides TaxID=1746091 RepID=A0ABQ8X3I7_9EUKA|nr:rni-like superfamily protein [Anaeramoeba flamelloides]